MAKRLIEQELRQQAVKCVRKFSSITNNPPVYTAHKENNHEAGRTKKFSEAQESKEAPCYEEVHGGEEIKGR